jgi:hypothetical protein
MWGAANNLEGNVSAKGKIRSRPAPNPGIANDLWRIPLKWQSCLLQKLHRGKERPRLIRGFLHGPGRICALASFMMAHINPFGHEYYRLCDIGGMIGDPL